MKFVLFLCSVLQIGMLKCIITMYEQSQRLLSESTPERKITWGFIKTTLASVIEKVKATKFEVRSE